MPFQYPTYELQSAIPLPAVASPPEVTIDDRLVLSRLGVYAGLFFALRAKHPPTAAHALRVAIGCSQWAGWQKMAPEDRELLEVAALLHDVGKIGVPDRVLQKPAQLDGQELLMMEMQRGIADELLRGAGASEKLVEIVRLAKSKLEVGRHRIPSAALMLTIVDAFDSMTTEQVFRRAMSRDRAVQELFANAGSQFDADLVQQFSELISQPRPELEAELTERWLHQLVPNGTPGFGAANVPVSCGAMQNIVDTLFHHRLLDTLTDAAIYLDSEGQILYWNCAAEQLTGRPAASVLHHRWTASMMGLTTEDGNCLPPESCPLVEVQATHTQVDVRLSVRHVDGHDCVVRFRALPVFSGQQAFSGAILVIRDASTETTLEKKIRSLHKLASHDQLTKVANRAELDRRLPLFLAEHLEGGYAGSLLMCDIDYFKRINDRFGHQAGDNALVTFAALLQEVARDDDLVARYGGEEFVVLCAGCDNTAATARAEQMRTAVERTPIPAIGGTTMTASFGVTEVQSGDDAETLIARADRALLLAKQSGRNRVVQVGAGQDTPSRTSDTPEPEQQSKSSWMGWFRGAGEQLATAEYLAEVPKEVAIEKLNGFINDHNADVLSIAESKVVVRIDGRKNDATRRRGERPAVMLMEIGICGVEVCTQGRTKTYQRKTRLTVTIRPSRARDRRSDSLRSQANQLLHSFQAYLVARVIDDELRHTIIEPR